MPHVDAYDEKGKRIPSVTEVLSILRSKGLETFANHLGFNRQDYKTFMDELGVIGTATHAMAQAYLEGVPYKPVSTDVTIEMRADKKFQVFKAWAEEAHPKALAMEKHLNNGRYAGTFDAILQYPEGAIGLVDFKTSKRPRPYQMVQLGGYLNLIEECEPDLYKELTFASLLILGQNDGTIKIVSRNMRQMRIYQKAFEQIYMLFMVLKDILWDDWNRTRIIEGWTQ